MTNTTTATTTAPATIISSQRYIDDDIVQSKRGAEDYIVTISPEFRVAGHTYQAIVDGHHSLQAARLDNVDPVYVVATAATDDRVALLSSNVDDYLTVCYMDSDWYDIATSRDVF